MSSHVSQGMRDSSQGACHLCENARSFAIHRKVLRVELEDHLFFLCTQVVYRRDRALSSVLKSFSLLATEWRTLGTLLRKGPMTMQELAVWTAYERTRLNRILNGMEARQWVARLGSEQDG